MSSGPRAAVEAASTLLEQSGAGPLTAAHVAVSYSLVRLGRLEHAIEFLRPPPGSAAVPEVDEPWDQWGLLSDRAMALIYAGRLGEAEELLTHAYERVIDQPAAEARGYITNALALLHLEQGRVQHAFHRANEAYTLFQQLGRSVVARSPYVLAAQALV